MKLIFYRKQNYLPGSYSSSFSTTGLFLVALTFFSFLLAGCPAKPKEERGPKKTVAVAVAKAILKDAPLELSAIGTAEACSTVDIKSQAGGELTSVHFKEGEDVKKGDILFTIDTRPFKAQLAQAEANLDRDIAQAKNAEIEAIRYKALLEKGLAAKEQYGRMEASSDALLATVRADRAAVENIKIQLGYCSIRSPINGRTGNLNVKAGNVIKANDLTIVTINQITPIYITFSLPEQQLPEIRRQMHSGNLDVKAVIPNDEQTPEQGMLSFIDNTVDNSTGTIRLKGIFTNKEERLWPGQFVNISLVLSIEWNAVVIPVEAVQTGQKGEYVFVVKKDMTVELRPVTLSRTMKNEAVIGSGLNAGETVVTDGQLQLISGAKVEIKKTSPAS